MIISKSLFIIYNQIHIRIFFKLLIYIIPSIKFIPKLSENEKGNDIGVLLHSWR